MNNSPDMPKQDGIDLSYVDSYEEAVGKLSPEEREDVAKRYDEILSILTHLLAGLRWQKEHIEEQVEFDRVNPYVLPEEKDRLLEYGESMAEYYALFMRLVFVRLDVMTAYKYLLLAQSDWEYRFFARRIYTLMYETYGSDCSYLKLVNKSFRIVKDNGDKDLFVSVMEKRDVLLHFLESKQALLKEVRKANEAHKAFEIDRLFRAVEKLSAKESKALIDEYKDKLSDFSKALVAFHHSVEESDKGLRTVSIPGLIGVKGTFTIKEIRGGDPTKPLRGIAFLSDPEPIAP